MAKILVIDDDTSILEVIHTILSEAGHLVTTDNGSCTIEELLDTHQPDLLVIDLKIPSESSTYMIHVARQHAFGAQMPIIILSAHSDIAQIANELPVNGFLAKPFDIDQFAELVQNHLP